MTGGRRSSTVVAFGEVLLRLAAAAGRRLGAATSLDVEVGGSEANVATHLARWGTAGRGAHRHGSPRLASRLPDGPLGDVAARTLRANGVDLRHTGRGAGRMGLYFLERGAGPRAPRVVYDRADSAFARIDPQSLDWPTILDGATHLHVSGITPALGPGPARAVRDALAIARQRAIATSFDLNHRTALWPAEQAGRAIGPLLAHVDLLIAPSAQLRSVLGCVADDDSERALVDQACAVSRKLGPQTIATTIRDGTGADRGGFRATLYDARADTIAVGPRYEVPFVDRVGAGDAFAAGLLFALGHGSDTADHEHAVGFATAAGALAHTLHGDAPPIAIDEIESLATGRDGRILR